MQNPSGMYVGMEQLYRTERKQVQGEVDKTETQMRSWQEAVSLLLSQG